VSLEGLFLAVGEAPGRVHDRVVCDEARGLVRDCISRLQPGYREVLLLRDIQELDTEQTSREMGIPPGAVKTRLHRARQALKELLEPMLAR
jgi:RNA polymerase sigma-70 factor (ECF subfamily)